MGIDKAGEKMKMLLTYTIITRVGNAVQMLDMAQALQNLVYEVIFVAPMPCYLMFFLSWKDGCAPSPTLTLVGSRFR